MNSRLVMYKIVAITEKESAEVYVTDVIHSFVQMTTKQTLRVDSVMAVFVGNNQLMNM